MIASSKQKTTFPVVFKTALELWGLGFDSKIDELLHGGLKPKSLSYVYGKNVGGIMNSLCTRAIHLFGGKSIFIDAANSFDPYYLVRECKLWKNDSKFADELLRSISLSRVFTCYQLQDLVTVQLGKMIVDVRKNSRYPYRSIFVSGIDQVFNEQDNTKAETERLQFFIASSLCKIAVDQTNNVMFVVASSSKRSRQLFDKSSVAIEFSRLKNGEKEAVLAKHDSRNPMMMS